MGTLLYLLILVSQCLEQMDVFLNRTNPCFLVVFLQISEYQQQEIKSLQLSGSVMGATGATHVAIRMMLENEPGYWEKIASISSSSVSCQIWSNWWSCQDTRIRSWFIQQTAILRYTFKNNCNLKADAFLNYNYKKKPGLLVIYPVWFPKRLQLSVRIKQN